MIATWWFYPAARALARYDFLFLCMITVQIALLACKLETSDEAKVILIYPRGRHRDGDLQDRGRLLDLSRADFFRIGGVPLFSGFMYACIGSYLCRAWRLFDFRFTQSSAAAGR